MKQEISGAKPRNKKLPPIMPSLIDDGAWPERGAFWAGAENHQPRRQLRNPQEGRAIVLTGHEINLQINQGALEIKSGFTHYPQQREEWRIFRGDLDRPSRIIVLEGSGAVTFDVLAWLAEQNIPLIQLDYRGNVVTTIGSSPRGGAHPELMRSQLTAANDMQRTLAISTWLVREKLIRSRSVLTDLVPASDVREVALVQLEQDVARLREPWAGGLVELLGVEGKNAEVYFSSWHGLPITWTGIGRRPIPRTWHSVGHRRSRGNLSRSARHPVQAMLNYGYAVLEGQVRIEVSKSGFDPLVGFLHQRRVDKLERQGLVLDIMEPFRPEVDRSVLTLIRGQNLASADFTLTKNGTCRLHPQLARRVVSVVAETGGIPSLVTKLVGMLDHHPPRPRPHRSNAWLAERGMLSHS